MRFRNRVEVVVTKTLQVWDAASVAPVRRTLPSPGIAVTMPPVQVVLAFGTE